MSLIPFVMIFPEQGERETRTLPIRGDSLLPEDEYALIEAYCPYPACDCRRVMLNVAGRRQMHRVEMASRHERTTAGLKLLKRAFQGEPLGPGGQQLQPPAPALANRLWLSGLSEVGAQYAAQHEVGLLLSRAAWASEEPTDVVQLPVAKAYLAEWQNQERKPRLGLSRGVYVAADKATALAEIRQDILQAMEPMIKQGRMPPGRPLDYYCKRLHLAYGHPDEVAAALSADQALPYSDDLILQFDPVFPTLERAIHMLEQLATQVAPALGWQPATS